MQPGYICVAGIDLQNRAHIRPVLEHGSLTRDLLLTGDGPFDLGCVVDLGATVPVGSAPEHEDHRFESAGAFCQGRVPDDYFWETLTDHASDTLQGIFSKDLLRREKSCTVDVGKGSASLGCLKPRGKPRVYVNDYGSIRVSFPWLSPPADLSLTDLRFYEEDHKTPRRDLVQAVDSRIEAGDETILSVGLTRAWQKPGDTEKRHWLQVNNIHLRSAITLSEPDV